MQRVRYSLLQRLLHWIVALCVLGALSAGFVLGTLGFEGAKNSFGLDTTNAIYKYHKSFGVLILGLMLVRLGLWVVLGRPALPQSMPGWQRVAAIATHGALYALLIAMPVVGWMATASGGFPIEFFGYVLPGFMAKDPELSKWLYEVHGALGVAILAVVALHIAAALHHWRVKRDGVMRRISLP
ncbi:cytochrome b [Limibaculum sp. M0105]|uniref:Cytochrome b n=1 Tax=Thermohalobaculum xanthum TaxID=2753746 RepID=A0A8J7M7D7_9RHOB|nr:cytochrome b [Thermohalobaculum xanthum]MBK0399719.1 cytochrome b [Thermohalobaculum xanthum]